MIDTSDNMKEHDYNILKIYALLDVIEFKTGIMAHENNDIKDVLDLWHSQKIKDYMFLNVLNSYIENKGY